MKFDDSYFAVSVDEDTKINKFISRLAKGLPLQLY